MRTSWYQLKAIVSDSQSASAEEILLVADMINDNDYITRGGPWRGSRVSAHARRQAGRVRELAQQSDGRSQARARVLDYARALPNNDAVRRYVCGQMLLEVGPSG
jgi:hypothetical protein